MQSVYNFRHTQSAGGNSVFEICLADKAQESGSGKDVVLSPGGCRKKIVAESDRASPEDSGCSPAFRRPASSPKGEIKALTQPVQLTENSSHFQDSFFIF